MIATGFEEDERAAETAEDSAVSAGHAAQSASVQEESQTPVDERAEQARDTEPQDTAPEEDIEVPDFLKGAMKAVNKRF